MTNYIYWDASTFYSNVKLDFSLDSGATWNIITTTATFTNGYYAWTIPQTFSTKCLIRASNSLNTSLYDISDAVFTIKPAITILTPNGGDTLGACTQTSITFEKSPAYSNANIEYTLNGGSSWTSLVANNNYGTTSTSFTYNWSIPNIASSNVKIRVYPTGNISLGDSSNSALTIKKAVTIVQPAYGGTMQVATVYPIKWKSEGISNLYDIAYTTNGGTTWTNIVTAYNTANSTYNWTVPNTVSSNCKIRVRDNVNSCKEDISQQAFIISATPAPLKVTYPNGGEIIQGCSLKTITWTETGTPAGSYTLEYSINAGTTWVTFATPYSTTSGSCPWYVPNFNNSNSVLIRVSAVGSTTIRDVSDALFTISRLLPTTNTVNLTSCSSIVYKGNTYTTSTTVRDTTKTATGLCDSIYNVANIIIQKNTTTQSLNFSGCQSVIYKGKTYTSSVTINDTTRTAQGCDSIYNTVYITVYNITPTTQTQNVSGCKKYIYKGITYTTNTTLRDTIRSISNCDSMYNVVNITINTNCINYINTVFTVNMVNYLATGNTIDTGGIRIAGNFADLGINLPNWTPTSQLCKLTKQGATDNWSITISIPDTSIKKTLYFKFVNTNWGKNEGIDFGSELRNSATCSVNDGFGNYNRFLKLPTQDSIVSYCWERCGLCNTTANAPIVTTGNITATTSSMVTVGNNNLIATGGSTVLYKGLLVSTNPLPNIYNNTFNSYFHYANPTLGTYSIYINGLYSNVKYYARAYASNEIGTTYGSVIPFVLCDTAKRDTLNLTGCGSLIYSGNTYTSSTTKRDTLKTILGCDSIYRVANITVQNITATTQTQTLFGCNSVVYNSKTYTTSTTVKDTLKTTLGCDSIYKVANITVQNIIATTQTQTLFGCNSVVYNSKTYTTSTTVKDTLRTTLGCDSIYKVANIAVQTISATTQTSNINGCNSVVYNGKTYTASTTVNDTLKTTLGCDSIYIVANITVTPSPVISSVTSNSPVNTGDTIKLFVTATNAASYNWQGVGGFSSISQNTFVANATLANAGWYYITVSNGSCSKKDSVLVNVGVASYTISGKVITPLKKTINNAIVNLTGASTASKQSFVGVYNFDNLTNGNYKLKLSKNNDVAKANGVSSVDVLLTQRHILNTAKLNSAYKLIAADVDGNKAINSVDVLRMKRLILGTDTTFTKTIGTVKTDRLWEFVDSAYQFPDTTNPFPFKDSINFTNLASNKVNQTFIGVKLGDVNYDWNATVAKGIKIDNVELIVDSEKKASVIYHHFSTNNFKNIAALQYTLHFDNDKYEFVNLEGFKNLQGFEYNSAQANATGNIAMLWTDKNAASQTLKDGSELFTLILKLKDFRSTNESELSLTNEVSDIEAWDNDYRKHNIVLIKRQTVKNTASLNLLKVYPNPSKGDVRVEVKGAKNIEIIDVAGRIIKSEQLKNDSNILNLKLSTGTYIIQAIMQDGTLKNEKLVVL